MLPEPELQLYPLFEPEPDPEPEPEAEPEPEPDPEFEPAAPEPESDAELLQNEFIQPDEYIPSSQMNEEPEPAPA